MKPLEPRRLPPPVPVESIVEHVVSPPTPLKTGNWRTQTPTFSENLAPCSAFCPAGNDVVGFIRTLADQGPEAASRLLANTTPLPGVCGRVCPAPCMDGCNRAELDGAVNIRGLERWIADRDLWRESAPTPASNPRRIAVVGGGPAGLAAAQVAARAGHRVTIFDGESELGGVLRTGIPSYRLPRSVLDAEIDRVLQLGVETRLGMFLTARSIQELSEEFDAVILATGLQRSRDLDVPGRGLAGVEQGIRFLRRINLDGGVRLDGDVVVLGGGNTAMDCARSAVRSGARRVTVVYRRSAAEMPAIREEVEQAESEGVSLLYLRQPVAIMGDDRVRAIDLAEVRLGEPDETGRRRPITTDVHHRLGCDTVLLALGQSADLGLLPAGLRVEDGRLVGSNGSGVLAFAAGDLSTGHGTVTHAIGDGRRAATRALRFLGEEVEVFERPDRTRAVPFTDIRVDHFHASIPTSEQLVPPMARRGTFQEVSQGLADRLEAHRCFSCGHCTQCDTCLVYCPEGIIRRMDPENPSHAYEVDYTYCKGCGICVTECPRHAIEMGAS